MGQGQFTKAFGDLGKGHGQMYSA